MKHLKQTSIVLIYITLIHFTSCIERTKLPQKNLKDFKTGSSFIFLNIENKTNSHIVVIENDLFYDIIQKEYNWGELEYAIRLNKLISNKKALPINDEVYSKLKENILDVSLISSFNKLDIVNDTNIIKKRKILNPKIEKRKQLAIIFILLDKNIKNCKVDDESGLILLSAP